MVMGKLDPFLIQHSKINNNNNKRLKMKLLNLKP